ncbi:hypothetical protein FRC00_004439 [Tulasnella sp. 408]|nr:hypothetical protein FRC00_004439 [Tulasnella sp. 408]
MSTDPDHQYRMHINDWVQKHRLSVIISDPIAYGPSHNQTWVGRVEGGRHPFSNHQMPNETLSVIDCWQCQDLNGQIYVAEGKTKSAANDAVCKLLLQDCAARGLTKDS